MQLVILDGYTENPGDLSWAELAALGELTVYDRTAPEDVAARIGEKRTRVPLKPVEMGGEPWPESGVQEAGGLY